MHNLNEADNLEIARRVARRYDRVAFLAIQDVVRGDSDLADAQLGTKADR